MARFRLRTFGGLTLESADVGTPVSIARRPLALLALLAAAGQRALSREKVTALLWPERDTERSRNSLSQLLSALRRDLGAEDIVVGTSEIRLNPNVITSDVADFELSVNSNPERAASLYVGPFLDGFFLTDAPEFERWVEDHRSRLNAQQRSVLQHLADEASQHNDGAVAVSWWRRLAAHDPASARAAIGLMEALAASGDRAAALQHFREYRRVLEQELGAEPEASVVAIAERLRRGEGDVAPVTVSPSLGVATAAERPPTLGSRTTRLPRLAVVSIGVIVLLAAINTMGDRARVSTPAVPTLALIPRMPVGTDSMERYFSEGITDQLYGALAKVPQVGVLGRESARLFSKDSVDFRDAARRLGVEYLVEVRSRVSGGAVRISVDLVRGSDATIAWSATYERNLEDLASLQREIAQQILMALHVKFAAETGVIRQHVANADAHEHYLRGRFYLTRGSEEDLYRALDHFARAIELDSLFAAPLAAAATAWNQLADAYVPPLDAYPKSDSLARRALQLDETNAEAHTNVGYAAFVLRWDWGTARREFLRALELNPSDAWTHSAYATYLMAQGDLQASAAEMRRATQLEPFLGYYAQTLALTFAYAEQLDSATAAVKRLFDAVPGYRYGDGAPSAYVLYRQGRCKDALDQEEARRKELGRPTNMGVICLATVGRKAEAEQAFLGMEAAFKQKYFFPEAIATAALALGQREKALDWFDMGVSLHSAGAPVAWVDPDMRPLLSDPRYRRALARMRLDARLKKGVLPAPVLPPTVR